MVVARRADRGLSTSELEWVRDQVAAGRKPKVVFTKAAGQIAGQQGQIVGLADPQVSDEWLVVRFGRDELPFSPADVAVAPKSSRGPRPAAEPVGGMAEVSGGGSAPDPSGPGVGQPAVGPSSAGSPADRSSTTKPPRQGAPEPLPASPDVSSVRPATRQAARKSGRAKPPAALVVTLAYADGDWSVSAQQGSRTVARPCQVRPAEALRMVALLEVPAVQEAVEEIVEAARAEAEAAAERLRAELAEVEARLAELRGGP